jgi:signal peptidase I
MSTESQARQDTRRERLRKEITDWLVTLLVAVAIALALRQWVLEPRVIPSGSMEPTIQVDEYVLTDKLLWRFTGLKRGQIIVFDPPFPSDKPYIKRLIGLPGDTVEVKGGKVYVNGTALEEPYIKAPPAYEYGPLTVPEGKLFFLGDNRNQSNDSHEWGTVTMDNVYGVAWLRIWPLGRFGVFDTPEYQVPAPTDAPSAGTSPAPAAR